MKKITTLALLVLLSASCTAKKDPAQQAWETVYPQIEQRIVAPTFPDRDFPITDFGAVADDSLTLNQHAINRAIAACSEAGGGRVVVPAGTWHTGPITLKSNVNLHIGEGARLLFTADTTQYPFVLTRWEGVDCYNFQPMIYAYGETNIALTGKGTIDGGADREHWWPMSAKGYGYVPGMVSQRTGRPKLLQWAEDNVPVEERRLTPQDGMRPQLVNFYQCENVLIEDLTLLRSPFWVIHPLLCKNLTVRGLYIQNDGPNGDGCDPESCDGVLIENCRFDTGDDCIAIKSGRNNDGRKWSTPSQNIIVRHCEMLDGHGGVVVGSEISGGYNNLFAHDCTMNSPNLDRVLRIKTSNCRGGTIENIYMRDITVGECKEAVLHINLQYDNAELCDRSFPPIVRNVYMENVTSEKSRYGVQIIGLEGGTNVYDISVKNCQFNGVTAPELNDLNGGFDHVVFNNLTINGQPVESPKAGESI
jgi:polygalacturonase